MMELVLESMTLLLPHIKSNKIYLKKIESFSFSNRKIEVDKIKRKTNTKKKKSRFNVNVKSRVKFNDNFLSKLPKSQSKGKKSAPSNSIAQFLGEQTLE